MELLLLLSVVVWVGGAGAARAAWTASEVPGTAGDFTVPQLVAGRDGTTLLGLLNPRGLAVSRVIGEVPGPPALLSPARTPFGEQSLISLTPGRRLAAVGTVSTSGGSRVWIADGPLGRPLGPQRTIVPRTRAEIAFAGSARGDIAIAVAEQDNAGSGPLRVVVRNPRGAVHSYRIHGRRRASVSPLFNIAPGPFGLAFNARGDLLVADSLVDQTSPDSTAALYTLETRLLTSSGRLGPVRRVARVRSGHEDSDGSSVHVALTDDQRGLVGWDLLPCGAGGGCGPSVLGVAASRRGARDWRLHRLATLAAGEALIATPVLVAASRDGGQIVWGKQRNGSIQVMTAAVHGRGLNGAVALSRPGVDSRPSALATTTGGATTVMWTERTTPSDPITESPGGLHAVSRAAIGPFADPQEVWDGQVFLGTQPSLLERRSGRPLAAWPNYDTTPGIAGPLIMAHG